MEHNRLNLILIVFNVIVFATYFVVSNMYIKDDMSKKLKTTEEYIVKEDWKKAEEMSKEIEKDWKKKKFFIMCNYGESEFDGFEGYINDITGSVAAKSLDTGLTTILSAQDAWRNLNKIIPLLLSELRVSGYTDLTNIKYAYLEPSGKVSVISKSEERPITPQTMGIEVPPVHLMLLIIVDGQVQETNLNFLQKDIKWLEKQFKSHNIKNVKDVLLAQYDTSGNLIINLKHQEFDVSDMI